MPVDCDQFHFNCGTPPAGTVVDNCIPIEKFRTGWPDCFSGLDEACTIGQYKCDGVCIPTTTNCTSADLLKLCHDLAPADAFKCKNGGCVPLAWLHDDENDCLDNSDDDPANLDECARGFQNCASGAECTNIPDSAFYCTCPEGQYGDGTVCQEDTGAIAQCPKASQTTSTAMTTTISDMNRVIKSIYYSRCMPAAPEIDCLDEAPTCMPFDKRLNGIVDCPGGVDEECMPGMTYCDKGKCVADDVADTQCLDRRVQASCEANNPAYFMCRNGTGCIIYQWAMDGVRDCADGSDEDPIIWNECLLGTDECDEHADCADAVNPPLTPDGRHTCTCKMSYTGDGKTCVPMA
uniref:EGF-like domain-containing protein n=1 Tax=Plectus sambesii TaxID=2011161 RepID=A0A914UUQ8_9BILA